jgi:hypothetical protein
MKMSFVIDIKYSRWFSASIIKPLPAMKLLNPLDQFYFIFHSGPMKFNVFQVGNNDLM